MNILVKIKPSSLLIRNKFYLNSFKNVSTKSLPLETAKSFNDEDYDSVVIIGNKLEEDLEKSKLTDYLEALKPIKNNHEKFDKDVTFLVSKNKRLIYSPTGPLNRDYDDVRRVGEAAKKAFKKVASIGSKKPLLINAVQSSFPLADQVALLSALEELYIPLEVREFKKSESLLKVDKLGFWKENSKEASDILKVINGVELGRIVARDIGGSDPERMSPPNVLKYVKDALKNTDIKMSVVEGQEEFLKSYPCFAAVNRAADFVPRHRGSIVKLEYNPADSSSIDTTLFLVGKGMTYDTGGADIKTNGAMVSMHRDKCGAAFIAGFFKTLDLLKPKGIKVHGHLCLTRNTIGEECYVSDEIIISRANKRIRIGNTDAEGRMAICDSLCEAKELALKEKNPHIFTIATLTGHVVQSYGQNYTGIMSNGPARSNKVDAEMQNSGELIGDPYEISRIRKEDYDNHKGKSEYEDLTQVSNNKSDRSRGHQGPASFLIMASGLDDHGIDSANPLIFSHVDIAGPSIKFPGIPSGAPLPSFAHKYILSRL